MRREATAVDASVRSGQGPSSGRRRPTFPRRGDGRGSHSISSSPPSIDPPSHDQDSPRARGAESKSPESARIESVGLRMRMRPTSTAAGVLMASTRLVGSGSFCNRNSIRVSSFRTPARPPIRHTVSPRGRYLNRRVHSLTPARILCPGSAPSANRPPPDAETVRDGWDHTRRDVCAGALWTFGLRLGDGREGGRTGRLRLSGRSRLSYRENGRQGDGPVLLRPLVILLPLVSDSW